MGMIEKLLEALLKQREEILIPNSHVNEISNHRDPPNSASTLKSTSNLVPMYNSHVNPNWIPISFPNPASKFNSYNHLHKGTPVVNRFFVQRTKMQSPIFEGNDPNGWILRTL